MEQYRLPMPQPPSSDNNDDCDILLEDSNDEEFQTMDQNDIKKISEKMKENSLEETEEEEEDKAQEEVDISHIYGCLNILNTKLEWIAHYLVTNINNTTNNGDVENNLKRKKTIITFDDKICKGMKLTNDPNMRLIMNANTKNFGIVVGKNGNTHRHLESKYNVHIFVPTAAENIIFPHIVIQGNRNRYKSDIDGAMDEIIYLLR